MHAFILLFYRYRVLLATVIVLTFAPARAIADSQPQPESHPWSVRLGLGAYSAPEYSGSDEFESFLFPSIDVNYKDFFFASVLDGVGFNVIRNESWGAIVSGQIVIGREAEGDIEALDPIDDRVMPKVEVFTKTGPLRLHASVIGDGKRNAGETGFQYIRPLSQRALYMLGGGARWNNRDWNDERFSLTVSEADSLELEAFEAEGALTEGYMERAFIYYLSANYVLEAAVEVAELTGNPADSPLVTELGTPTQPQFFLRITRPL